MSSLFQQKIVVVRLKAAVPGVQTCSQIPTYYKALDATLSRRDTVDGAAEILAETRFTAAGTRTLPCLRRVF